MQIPAVIFAGDTPTWTDPSYVDAQGNSISSQTYGLTYSLRGPSTGLDLAGTSSGSGWKFAFTTAQTAALNAGSADAIWYWQAVATKSGYRATAGSGTLRVRPNVNGLAAGATFDGRSQAEIDLAAVRAEMSARISGGATVEYTIGTRSLKKEPMAALIEMEQRLLRMIRRQKAQTAAANGLGNPGRIGVRFS